MQHEDMLHALPLLPNLMFLLFVHVQGHAQRLTLNNTKVFHFVAASYYQQMGLP